MSGVRFGPSSRGSTKPRWPNRTPLIPLSYWPGCRIRRTSRSVATASRRRAAIARSCASCSPTRAPIWVCRGTGRRIDARWPHRDLSLCRERGADGPLRLCPARGLRWSWSIDRSTAQNCLTNLKRYAMPRSHVPFAIAALATVAAAALAACAADQRPRGPVLTVSQVHAFCESLTEGQSLAALQLPFGSVQHLPESGQVVITPEPHRASCACVLVLQAGVLVSRV